MTENNHNVDPAEIEKFSQFAEDWWNPNGKMKPLHQLNPLRLKYIQDHADVANKKVLDVGCGGGLLSEAMARACADVTGIDMSEAAIQVAQQHAEQQRVIVNYQCQTIETHAEKQAGLYDVITCMEMLEHVPDPKSIVDACAKCLKPGGKLFFSTINRNPKSFLAAIVGAEYILGLLPKGTHEYVKLIKPSELTTWASCANLKLVGLQGVSYQIFSSDFSLSKDVSINYMAHYEK